MMDHISARKDRPVIMNRTNLKTETIRLILADQLEVYGKPGDNMNTVVVGLPGCGKTFSYMLPAILCDSGCSMVIDDKKGNLYHKTADTLRKRGYMVLKIDFIRFNSNFRYNCFQKVKTEEDIMRMADFMIPKQGKNVDRYWEMAAKNLFRCLMEIARHEYRETLNLRLFMEIFNKCGLKSDDEYDNEGKPKEDKIEALIKKHKAMHYKYEAMWNR